MSDTIVEQSAREPKSRPVGRTDRSARCALNQWQALTRFLQDGELEKDNGATERANRDIALGRAYALATIMCSPPLPSAA